MNRSIFSLPVLLVCFFGAASALSDHNGLNFEKAISKCFYNPDDTSTFKQKTYPNQPGRRLLVSPSANNHSPLRTSITCEGKHALPLFEHLKQFADLSTHNGRLQSSTRTTPRGEIQHFIYFGNHEGNHPTGSFCSVVFTSNLNTPKPPHYYCRLITEFHLDSHTESTVRSIYSDEYHRERLREKSQTSDTQTAKADSYRNFETTGYIGTDGRSLPFQDIHADAESREQQRRKEATRSEGN